MMESNKAVRPFHADGYINLMNKWGTSQDTSEAYSFHREPATPDMQLTSLYEGNGLFARIIDTPAEEALKHGFDLGLNSPDVESFVKKSLDMLDWEEKAATAIKWARLYGGSLIVMLIDDGRGLEEPLNWRNIRSIDELCVFERPIVWPDYNSLYNADFGIGKGRRETKFMQPQYYDVSSIRGSFRVHESRCLVFKNGSLPEGVSNENYRYWGLPEYTRIRRALQDTIIAHSNGPKLLERSVQPIYKMKNLASLMASDFGESHALKRLQLIDMARGMMNTVAIDAEGEEYDFKTFSFSGVVDIIDSTCNMLSALTNIPQTILFGRSPAGENSTGESDMENWYSFVERIQRLSVKPNLHSLLDVLFAAGIASGEVEEEPEYELKFNPLWSLSDDEQSAAEKTKADTAYVKAQTAHMYVEMQALDPSEVRSALAKSEDFEVEEILDDIPEDELFSELPGVDTEAFESEQQIPPGDEQEPSNAPPEANQDASDSRFGVGVLVIRDGKILTGLRRAEGTFCGPGGHIEDGESPEQAAIRETQEEFGITPKELIHLGELEGVEGLYCPSTVFLCTDYEGRAQADGEEMQTARFMEPEQVFSLIKAGVAFQPFAESIQLLLSQCLTSEIPLDTIKVGTFSSDGGPGSGNFGHKGVPGQVGGSSKSGTKGVTKFERKGGKMSVTSEVKLTFAGKPVALKAGSDITKIVDFAGSGKKRPVDVESHLIKQYGGKAGSWTHTRGQGTIVLTDGGEQKVELHWFESKEVGQVNMKIKNLIKGGSGDES